MLTRVLAAILSMMVPVAALASDPPESKAPPPAPDGKVSGLQPAVFQQLIDARSNAGFSDRTKAEALQSAIRADNQIDIAEADLLSELTRANVRAITVDSPQPGRPPLVMFQAFGEAKLVLTQTLRPLTSLRRALDGGADGWRGLVEAYDSGLKGQAAALELLTERLTSDAKASNVTNRYKPFRDRIEHYFTLILSTNTSNGGKNLLYSAAQKADADTGEKMPDFTYNYLKPTTR